MAGKPTFAEFTAALSADDDELQKDLKSAETATKRSAEIMQSNLDGVAISGKTAASGMRQFSGATVGAGEASRAATQSITALGVAASTSGNQFVGLAAQIGSVAAASDELALAFTGVGKSGVLLLKALGPIAIVVAIIAAGYSFLTGKVKEFDDAVKARAQEKADLLAGPARELALIEDKIKLRLGELTERQVERNRLGRDAINDQEEFELRLKIFDVRKAEAEEVAKIAAAKQREATMDKTRRQLAVRDFNRQRVREAEETSHNQRQLDLETRRREEADKAAQSRLENLQGSAQSLLIQLGAAKPSDFIDDPRAKRLAAFGELIGERERAAAAVKPQAARTGTFGLSRVQSPLAVVRGGEVIGRQTLTIQEQTKQIVADHRDITAKIFMILDNLNRRSNTNRGGGQPLTVTDRA